MRGLGGLYRSGGFLLPLFFGGGCFCGLDRCGVRLDGRFSLLKTAQQARFGLCHVVGGQSQGPRGLGGGRKRGLLCRERAGSPLHLCFAALVLAFQFSLGGLGDRGCCGSLALCLPQADQFCIQAALFLGQRLQLGAVLRGFFTGCVVFGLEHAQRCARLDVGHLPCIEGLRRFALFVAGGLGCKANGVQALFDLERGSGHVGLLGA